MRDDIGTFLTFNFETVIAPLPPGLRKVQRSAYLELGVLPVVDQGGELIGGYTNDLEFSYPGKLPVILFGDHTRRFKFIDFRFALGADGVKVIAVREPIEPKYLYYFLSSQTLPDRGYSRHYQFLREVQVRLPAPSEQRRIVELLDQADALRRLRAEADAKAGRILPALFIKMFGDPVTNPKGWTQRPIGDLGQITTGNTPSRECPQYYGSSIEWIKSDNINTPSHYLTKATEYLSDEGLRVGRLAPAGSVLVTCIAGSPECIGNAAMADRDVAFNQQINAITPHSDVDPYFLYAQLLVGKKLVQSASTGAMKGMVNKSRFSQILFLAPPEDLQSAFGRLCEGLCQNSETKRNASAKLDTLFSTLLAQAFDGRLTLSWREAHMNELLQEMEQQARALSSQTLLEMPI